MFIPAICATAEASGNCPVTKKGNGEKLEKTRRGTWKTVKGAENL